MTQWGVWEANVEAVGFNSLETYHQGFGEERPLTSAPGHLFRHDEFLDSAPCLVKPMLLGWDAYCVPQFAYGHLEYFLFGQFGFEYPETNRETYQKVIENLKKFSWIEVCGNSKTTPVTPGN